MDYKFVISVIGAIVGNAAFYPYVRDIFRGTTKPHIYTWLIWVLTQGTAVAALLYGGGGIGGLTLIIGLALIIFVLLLSFKYGSKNITVFDTVVFVSALCAILVWSQLKNPVLAVIMVTVIDAIGYIPSIRKAYQEPWSETMWTWGVFAFSDILALFSLREYNILTVTYLSAIVVLNLVLFSTCLFRRRKLKHNGL